MSVVVRFFGNSTKTINVFLHFFVLAFVLLLNIVVSLTCTAYHCAAVSKQFSLQPWPLASPGPDMLR